jgi:hypothetical protein
VNPSSRASEAGPDSGAAPVALAQHCAAFASDQGGVPEFSPRRKAHSASLIGVGELHGRKLASALMRSRLHNRTRDRGGVPIRLMEGALPPVLPGPGRGRSLKSSAPLSVSRGGGRQIFQRVARLSSRGGVCACHASAAAAGAGRPRHATSPQYPDSEFHDHRRALLPSRRTCHTHKSPSVSPFGQTGHRADIAE